MRLGNHLRVTRNGVTDHAIDIGDGTVIRFLPDSGGGRPEVRRARLLDFAGGERVEVVTYPSRVYPPEMVVARAFNRLGDSAAGAMFASPEHFATWCVNGQAPVRPLAGPAPAPAAPAPEPPAAAPARPEAPKAASRAAAKAGMPARAAPPKRAAKAKARPAPARKRKAASGKPTAKAGRAKAPARKAPARRPAKGRAAKRRR